MKRLIVICALAVFAAGCMPYATYTTPEVMDQGSLVAGGGVGFFLAPGDTASLLPVFPGDITIMGRYGVHEKIDAGFRIAGNNLGIGVFADGKYALQTGDLPMAVDLGVSFQTALEDTASDINLAPYTEIGLHPTFLIGKGAIYGGLKLATMFHSDEGSSFIRIIPGALVGIALGKKSKYTVEFNAYYDLTNGSFFLYPAIGYTKVFLSK